MRRGQIKATEGFGKIIVARRAKRPVYLDQVAEIVDGEKEDDLYTINGKPGSTPGAEGEGAT